MKKMVTGIAAMAICSTLVFAIDISYETGSDQSIKKDKSMSVKKGNEQKSSRRDFESSVDSKSYSADITFDPTPIYLLRANQCVKSISVAADFGLSAVIDDDDTDGIDLNKKNYIDNAASSSMLISKIPGVEEDEVKNFIACIVGESARMAQSNIQLQKSLGNKIFSSRQLAYAAVETFESVKEITEPSVRLQYLQAINSLNQQCRFVANLGRDSIQCGTLVFSFVDNSVRQSGTLLSVGQNSYGIGSSLRVSLNDVRTDGKEIAKENSKSSSRDSSLTQTGSNSVNRASKKSTSVSPFLPK